MNKNVFRLCIGGQASLKPIAPNWAPRFIYSRLFQVHTTTHCRVYREQQLSPSPPKAAPVSNHQQSKFIKPSLLYFLVSLKTSSY